MTDLASTDVTVTLDPRDRHILGKLKMSEGSLAFGDGALTYPYGGVEMPSIGTFGMNKEVSMFDIVDASANGLTYRYDQTNRKIKMFAQAPPIVYEEAHTVPATPFGITLKYPAAAILNVASSTVGYDFIEASDTVAAGEAQLTSAMAEGVRTGLTFHSEVGAVKVTYITQAWAEVWAKRSAATAVSTGITEIADLGTTVCFIESCLAAGGTASSKPGYLRGGDTPATTECEVDFTDSGSTTLTFAAADAITGVTVTYIELPASGFIYDRFLEDQDTTIAAGASTALNPLHPVLFHAIGGSLPDYHNAGERDPHTMQMLMGDAVGTAGEFVINYQQRPAVGVTDMIGTEDATTDAVSLTYVWGLPEEITGGIVPLEVGDGTILQSTTLKFMAWGK